MASGDENGIVHILRVPPGTLKRTLFARAGVSRLVFSPDARWLVAGQRNGALCCWDLTAGGAVVTRSLPGASRGVGALFSPDRQQLAAFAEPGVTCFWDVRDGRLLHTIKSPLNYRAGAFGPAVTFLINNRLFEIAQPNRPLRLFWPRVSTPLGVAFSRDGRLVARAGREVEIEIWGMCLRQSG